MARLHSETIPTSTLAATARVADSFVTTHTDLAGRTISSTARRGSVKNDTFTHNDRSESARQSPRRLVGGLDKRAAFAPQGRGRNGVAARHPRMGRLRQQAVRAIGQTRSVCPEGASCRWGGSESPHPVEQRIQRQRARPGLLQLPSLQPGGWEVVG